MLADILQNHSLVSNIETGIALFSLLMFDFIRKKVFNKRFDNLSLVVILAIIIELILFQESQSRYMFSVFYVIAIMVKGCGVLISFVKTELSNKNIGTDDAK